MSTNLQGELLQAAILDQHISAFELSGHNIDSVIVILACKGIINAWL